ncbi:MAG: tautomerase family protein [Prevotellaceae bacterium]|nr:tautomerase family protein [Candidatus Faecinaster equi]
MPHININMFVGRDDETKKRVADAIVETMMKELGCAKNHLSVAIHDVEPANWDEEIGAHINADELYAGEVFKASERK